MNQFYSSFLSNDFLGVSSPVAFSSISLSNVLLKPGLLTLNFNWLLGMFILNFFLLAARSLLFSALDEPGPPDLFRLLSSSLESPQLKQENI